MRPNLALAALALTLITGCGASGPDRYEAEAICQQFVKERLKSPGTADFGDETTTEAGGEWTVTGSVDSENLFGGTVRNRYTCVARPRPDGKLWDLVSLTGLTN